VDRRRVLEHSWQLRKQQFSLKNKSGARSADFWEAPGSCPPIRMVFGCPRSPVRSTAPSRGGGKRSNTPPERMDTGPRRAWNLLRFEPAVPSATPSYLRQHWRAEAQPGRWGSNWTTTASKRVILTRSPRSEITSHRLRNPMPLRSSGLRLPQPRALPLTRHPSKPLLISAINSAAFFVPLSSHPGWLASGPGFGTKTASMRCSDESRNCEADCGRSGGRGLLCHRIRLPTRQPIAAASILLARVTVRHCLAGMCNRTFWVEACFGTVR
jgi:hypothetical protein